MQYKGYTITAELECYRRWLLDANGELTRQEDPSDTDGEVVAYCFVNEETGDDFTDTMSYSSKDDLEAAVDFHIEELAR